MYVQYVLMSHSDYRSVEHADGSAAGAEPPSAVLLLDVLESCLDLPEPLEHLPVEDAS